ncbi:MAG: hypothetical protein UIH41_00230, partial [Treponemataceae bacterium]|nr:hypothetical protein [Treponemataceae bacterium]
FINSDSHPNEKSNQKELTRGIGSKSERKNGHRVISNDFEPLYNDLISLLSKFNKAIHENDNTSNWLESHPIFQDALKNQYLNFIKDSSSKIIDKLEALPSPFFNGLIEKFAPTFKELTCSFMQFVNILHEYNNAHFISISEDPSKNELLNSLANALANSSIISESSEIKQLNHQINPLKNKAQYRKIQKELSIKEEERSNLIKSKLFSLGIDVSSDYKYQEDFINNYETLANLFPIIYNNLLQDGIPNVTFHFNDIN